MDRDFAVVNFIWPMAFTSLSQWEHWLSTDPPVPPEVREGVQAGYTGTASEPSEPSASPRNMENGSQLLQ